MFDRMENSESINEVLVEHSHEKSTRADDNHAGRSRKNRG